MFRKEKYTFIFAILLLILGGLIYTFFRNVDLLFFSWLRSLPNNIFPLRQENVGNNIIFTYAIYNLPHGLWVLSGLLLLKFFLKNEKRILLFYSVIFILIAILKEIGQFFGIIKGNFDIFDLVTIVLFSSIGFALNFRREKYEKI
ncbi:MAG: hypothetical protein FWC65_00440 [Treponema sp.]|nr:hypothetical protein [Treponema sp.]